MKILNIAYYTILRNFRDKRSTSLTLLFPILLILILGSALSKLYEPDNLSKISAIYVNEDRGQMSAQFDKFLQIKDVKNLVEVTQENDYDKGISLVKNKKASTMIYIPRDYTAKIMSGKKGDIKVYLDKEDLQTTAIITNLLGGFTSEGNTILAISHMGAALASNPQKDVSVIKDMPMTKEGNIPRAIDYYAVTMLAMTLMYGTLFASFSMAEDKDVKTYIRIKSSPTRDFENYIGKTLGTITTLMLEVIILIAFTKLVYHVNWGTNIPEIIGLGFLFSCFATGLGIFAYAITNNAMRSSAVLNVLTFCLTFVGGGYAKIKDTGSAFDKIAFFAPNKMFQTAVFNTIYGGPISETQSCIIGIVGITVVLFIIASTVGRKVLN
jgi:ABC-2 type transport system permease protein